MAAFEVIGDGLAVDEDDLALLLVDPDASKNSEDVISAVAVSTVNVRMRTAVAFVLGSAVKTPSTSVKKTTCETQFA